MAQAAGADLPLMAAWLAARSLSRGLPAPVPDRGGIRVDTGHADERRRYVFAAPCEGLRELGRELDEPFVPLKLCCPAEELLALLPRRWTISSNSWVMGRGGFPGAPPASAMAADRDGEPGAGLPPGYTLIVEGQAPVWFARIVAEDGMLAASGYAAQAASGLVAESEAVFIYDRIKVDPAHGRRGLGRALMAALALRRDPALREVLTATAAGRALYLQLGWRDLAPYSTAVIVA
ncbi:GNAT family N-acetyltransferase [Sphingomonas sp.]|uniref:GNAT family N-acetyltransferase n=1 Tax=Sphingomonas sp. TaxID=28214 RepID=UPI000DB0DACC|nr:GNAT family N-acetyltransferase [Sphingomonas sp.]PZU09113.1 MAG: GNAT family N-acetyltransferase [Sphingomonas sp.]